MLKHLFSLLLVLFASLTPPGCAQPPPRGNSEFATPRDIILISWDGVGRAVLKDLLEAKRLPNLAALIAEGSLQEMEVVGHVTHTKPGHAGMLTGLGPEATGVLSNERYAPIPEGYSIFERLQAHFGKNHIRTVMIASKSANLGGRGPGETPVDPQDADNPDVLESVKKGEPYHLTKEHLDVFDVQTRPASASVGLFIQSIHQSKSSRLFAFLHLREPDNVGHVLGTQAKEYRDAVVVCDQSLGKIVAWLKSKHRYESTRVYVSTDHGFEMNTKTHDNAPHIWLATNDKAVTRGGTLADIAATILARFGLEVATLQPKLVGKPLN